MKATMQKHEPAREMARGKWPAILGAIMTDRMLSGRHGPCPVCGTKKDKFRFDDKDGTGSWICICSAGDGFSLLEYVNGWTFAEAAKYVESVAGKFRVESSRRAKSDADAIGDLRNVWEAARKLVEGDPVWTYLSRRCGITSAPMGVRYHPSLPYFHDDGRSTMHPAMVAQVISSEGQPLSIHRTYLTETGHKADVKTPQKLMTPSRKMEGVAIRLSRPSDGWLGVSEGIETALCASKRHGVPVWSCVSAGLLETFRPPEGVTLVTVFGDNDRSFTGQASAYKLARAIVALGIECRVSIPEVAGTDWADEVMR